MEAKSYADELTKKISQAIADRLKVAGEVVATNAKKECPVDTGRLRDSIESRLESDDTAIVGTNVEYAPFVELGTSRMEPNPFLRNGLADSASDIQKIFKEPIDK